MTSNEDQEGPDEPEASIRIGLDWERHLPLFPAPGKWTEMFD
ncbi:MAG: hypothetical protein RLZZ568_616 [Cyanobacteriota bacterium]